MKNISWSFYGIWNESLEEREERILEKRDHIWASELGGSMIDRYLKMNGEKPSNPPNPRSLRKFEAGNIWEWIVGTVLKKSGLFLGEQGWVSYKYPNLLEVTGKLDFLAGGRPDWERAGSEINENNFPKFIVKAARSVVESLSQSHPDGMKEIVLEIKSCSGFMFERYLKSGVANPNHKLQLFHYLKAKNMDEGHVVYVSKDDARVLEVGVLNPSPVEMEYREDIEKVTNHLRSGQQPPLEKPIIFDYEFGSFSANWKVGYSNYLTRLYGYKDQLEFDSKNKPTVGKWNRVVKRMVNGDKMTAKNMDVIKEIEASYPGFIDIIAKLQLEKEKTEEAGK